MMMDEMRDGVGMMGGMGVRIALRRLGWLGPHSAAKRLAEIT